MTKYARIADGHLIDVWRVPEDYPDIATRDRCLGADGWISVPDDAVHGARAAQDGTYQNPAVSTTAVKKWDAFEFKMRLTADERKAIRAAAKLNADMEDFVDMLDTAAATGTMIHADNQLVLAALDAMTPAILAEGRKAEILG